MENQKVLPIATLNNREKTEDVLSCLRESSLKAVEVTYRTDYAREAIRYAPKCIPIFWWAHVICRMRQTKACMTDITVCTRGCISIQKHGCRRYDHTTGGL